MGQVAPLGGSFLLGHQIDVGYFDQDLAQFDSSKTVLEEVWDSVSGSGPYFRSGPLWEAFCLRRRKYSRPSTVSPAVKKCVFALVKLMLAQPNFLMLDEPTNHLDLLGKEALEESLENYEGTMLFVSHDRYFICQAGNGHS